MAKSLLSIALAADRLVLFDNVSTGFSVGGKSLDRVLTSGLIKGRVLGRSEWTPALPVHTVFLATGNKLNLKGDALRRVVPCRLESEVERPEERKGFEIPDLLGHARMERGNLVVAALTILRGYILAGRPEPNLTPMDYRAWCGLIRNAVHWSTGLDPCKPRENLRENDPETNFRRALVHGWAELPGAERGLTVAEAIKHLEGDAEHRSERFEQLRGALLERTRNGELPSRGSIGKLLGANKGRVVDGKALQQGDAGKHTIAWKVIDVSPPTRGGDSGDSGDDQKPTRRKGDDSGNTQIGAIEAKHTHYPHHPHRDDDYSGVDWDGDLGEVSPGEGVSTPADREDMGALANHGMLVSMVRSSLEGAAENAHTIGDLLPRIIDGGMWRDFMLVGGGRHRWGAADFRAFLERPWPEGGCQSSLPLIERMAGGTPAWDALQGALALAGGREDTPAMGDDLDRLIANGEAIRKLQTALSLSEYALTFPEHFLQMVGEGSWRKYLIRNARDEVEIHRWGAADFRAFLERPWPGGLGASTPVLELVLRDTDAWSVYRRLIDDAGGPPP